MIQDNGEKIMKISLNIILEKINYEGKDRIVLAGVVGSHNTNTNNENSDIDLQCYVIPTINELLEDRKLSKIFHYDNIDIQIHDIRNLYDFAVHGDINKIGILYNDDIYIRSDMRKFCQEIIDRREEISACVHQSMIKWVYRLYLGRLTVINYFRENEPIPICGYNAKGLRQTYVYIFLLKNYFNNYVSFKSEPMKKALDCSEIRDKCKKIDQGEYDREEAIAFIQSEIKTLSAPCIDKNIKWLSEYIKNMIIDEYKKNVII